MKAFTTLLVPLLTAVYVSAHGILVDMSVNGQSQGKNVVRQVSTQDPNRGASNPALLCGPNSRPASGNARVNPGDTLSFNWRTASNGAWPHNTGPMLTYLANCGGVTCDKFDANQARWFKIDQVARKPNSGEWFQQDLMNGGQARVKLPANLAAGNYLVRHEIIALHLATSRGGAEFYPGCAQLIVGGTATGKPQEGDLRTFPGAYSDNDAGIFTPSVFNSRVEYVFPGPRIAPLEGGAGAPAPAPSSSSGAPAPSSSGAPAQPKPSTPVQGAPAPPKTGKSGSCKLKKNTSNNGTHNYKKRSPVDADTLEADNEVIIPPRHLSRVMRRLAFAESH